MADEVVENATATNATERIPATPEGMAIAYGSLLVMALIPIYFGAFRSVKFVQSQHAKGEKIEKVSQKDAMLFPIIASFALLSLYIIYKLVPKEYITVLLLSYFFIIGVLALAHILNPFLIQLIPKMDLLPNLPYRLLFTRGKDKDKEGFKNLPTSNLVVDLAKLCKHWLTNNLFGLAFCLNGIELIHLSSFKVGAMLLGGLFVYDIFWVFKTDVMVTVAKNVEAPIKLMFPQDLLEKGLAANNCAMLGLGDIVIPGIFIALLLRFDARHPSSKFYFHVTFAAYILGLVMTIFVMHVFKHAQPALLYLVPMCLGVPSLFALIRGEVKNLFNYDEEVHAAESETKKK